MNDRCVKLKMKTPMTRNAMKLYTPRLVSRITPKMRKYTATLSSGVSICQTWPSLASVYMATFCAVAKPVTKKRRCQSRRR